MNIARTSWKITYSNLTKICYFFFIALIDLRKRSICRFEGFHYEESISFYYRAGNNFQYLASIAPKSVS